MPKLGAYTDDVLLVEWLVDEGEQVAAGRRRARARDREDDRRGRGRERGLRPPARRRGRAVPIGTTVGADRRDARGVRGARGRRGRRRTRRRPTATRSSATSATAAERPSRRRRRAVPAPARRRRRRPAGEPRRPARLAARAGAAEASSASRSRTPRAIAGSGPGGRILDRDVAAWAAARDAGGPRADGGRADRRARRSRCAAGAGRSRRRMVASLQTAAQLTSVLELDVKPLVELRSRLNADGRDAADRRHRDRREARRRRPARASGASTRASTETEIELLERDQRRRRGRHGRRARRAGRAPAPTGSRSRRSTRASPSSRRARATARSTPDDLAGGTFTVSNGGIHPVDITTAILNPPQVGILWIGRIRDRPVVVGDGAIAVRPTMQACLTFDHRAVDGGARRGVPRPRSSARRRPAGAPGVSAGHDRPPTTLLGLYRTMLTIRLFEQRVAREFRTGEIPGFVHMYVGEEAVAAGVCANLDDDDYVTSTHRGHGHCIAKGCDLGADDGRDLRPRGRPLQGARRLDAHRRLLARDARRERDRRRRHRARDRRRRSRRACAGAARSRSRSSATAPRTRACSTRASTSPRSGSCR